MRSTTKPDQLETTFPVSILRLINELDHWVLLGIEVPHYAAEAHRRKSELPVGVGVELCSAQGAPAQLSGRHHRRLPYAEGYSKPASAPVIS